MREGRDCGWRTVHAADCGVRRAPCRCVARSCLRLHAPLGRRDHDSLTDPVAWQKPYATYWARSSTLCGGHSLAYAARRCRACDFKALEGAMVFVTLRGGSVCDSAKAHACVWQTAHHGCRWNGQASILRQGKGSEPDSTISPSLPLSRWPPRFRRGIHLGRGCHRRSVQEAKVRLSGVCTGYCYPRPERTRQTPPRLWFSRACVRWTWPWNVVFDESDSAF